MRYRHSVAGTFDLASAYFVVIGGDPLYVCGLSPLFSNMLCELSARAACKSGMYAYTPTQTRRVPSSQQNYEILTLNLTTGALSLSLGATPAPLQASDMGALHIRSIFQRADVRLGCAGVDYDTTRQLGWILCAGG